MTVQPTAEVYAITSGMWGCWSTNVLNVGDLIATDCVGGWDHPRVVYFSKVLSKSDAGLIIEEPLR